MIWRSEVAGRFFTKLYVDAIRLILFNYNKSNSHEVVVVLNIVFAYLHKVKTVIPQVIVFHGSD
jgi:hypothetical protein